MPTDTQGVNHVTYPYWLSDFKWMTTLEPIIRGQKIQYTSVARYYGVLVKPLCNLIYVWTFKTSIYVVSYLK